MAKNTVGIRNRLKIAMSETEISSLLKEGESYEFASEETRENWQKTAEKRRGELQKAAEAKKIRKQAQQTPAAK